MTQKISWAKKIMHEVRALLLGGVLTLLPLVFTGAVLLFCYRVVAEWVAPIRAYEPRILRAIPYSEYFFILAITIAVGAVARFLIFTYFIGIFETLLKRIPLVRHVYFGVKQLMSALTAAGDGEQQHRPVLIEFPRKGMHSIGFLTGAVPARWAPNSTEQWVSVFVPTTPNPTTGFYLIVSRSECTELALSRQEAMTLIISGGVIQPDSDQGVPGPGGPTERFDQGQRSDHR